MIHENDEVLKVCKVLADKVIKFSDRCKNQEHESLELKCHELEDIAAMARQVEGDLQDYTLDEYMKVSQEIQGDEYT